MAKQKSTPIIIWIPATLKNTAILNSKCLQLSEKTILQKVQTFANNLILTLKES